MYIKVKVKTGQKKETLEKIDEETLEISVKEKPERNLANKRICDLLLDYFGSPEGGVKIINGHHSPVKLFKIGK